MGSCVRLAGSFISFGNCRSRYSPQALAYILLFRRHENLHASGTPLLKAKSRYILGVGVVALLMTTAFNYY